MCIDGDVANSFPKRHQAEMEDEPDWKSEDCDGEQILPHPVEIMCLDREDHDHQIIREARMTEEGAVFGIFAAQAAEESKRAESEDEEGDKEIYGQHGIEGEVRPVSAMRTEVGPEPLRTGPEKAEAGLDCGAKVCFG